MSHRCVHCGKFYQDASKELLEGCSCGSKFFFYMKQEQVNELNADKEKEIELPIEFKQADKNQIEKDIRDIMKDVKEDQPVILDLESIRVLGPGKFEIDVVNLFNKKLPVIYKLEEGKYIIDLASSMKVEFEKGKDN